MVGAGARRRVLVIDDDADIRRMLGAFLVDEGYAVLAAGDGEQGLRHAREWRPHVIICDLIMPRMNGYEFVGAYGETPPPRAAVIVMTAAGPGAKRAAEELRPDEFVAKPLALEELLEPDARHDPQVTVLIGNHARVEEQQPTVPLHGSGRLDLLFRELIAAAGRRG